MGDGTIDWDYLALVLEKREWEWATTAGADAWKRQRTREMRVAAINTRLGQINAHLDASWLPAETILALTAERDDLWLELARDGEWPFYVRRDGPARYQRKAP